MEQYFKLYYQELVYFAAKILHDQLAAEDIVCDTFLNIVLKPEIEIKAQFYVYVKYRCLDYLRKQKLHTLLNKKIFTDEFVFIENSIIEADVLKNVCQAIERLAPICREVIKLYYIRGLSYEEISKLLNKPIATIRSHRRLGINNLKKFIL